MLGVLLTCMNIQVGLGRHIVTVHTLSRSRQHAIFQCESVGRFLVNFNLAVGVLPLVYIQAHCHAHASLRFMR